MGQIWHQLLHVFSVNLGVIILNKIFAEVFFPFMYIRCDILCDVCGRCVKDFKGNKRIKDSFRFFCMLSPTKGMIHFCKFISIRLILFNDFMKEEGS